MNGDILVEQTLAGDKHIFFFYLDVKFFWISLCDAIAKTQTQE